MSRTAILTDLYRRHLRSLQTFLMRRTSDADEAADLAQETYVRLARLPDLERVRSPRAFLFRTALNLLIDERRASSKWRDHSVPLRDDLRSEDDTPEEAALANDTARLLSEAIEALPQKCRRVFVLHKIHGLSYAEIEEKTGIRPRAIEKHICRGMLRVQEYFEAYIGRDRAGEASE